MGGLLAFHVALRKARLLNGCIFINPALQDNRAHNRIAKKFVLFFAKYFPNTQLLKSRGAGSTKYYLNEYK